MLYNKKLKKKLKLFLRIFNKYNILIITEYNFLKVNGCTTIIFVLVYNKGIFTGIISKLYNIHGTSIMNAITIGNKTVQQ